ncbi:MAG TPA: phospholipase D-like domain-containing protein [Vicinamibacteria bacterium]|nr:phospholipase D-like domain-containing protein [Vicinamibacteria bacterium]
MVESALLIVQWIAIAFLSLMLFLALFEPPLPYRVSAPPAHAPDTEEFLRTLAALTGAQVRRSCSVEVLSNGEVYYEAELAAIGQAVHSINLEAYIFKKGEVTRRFLEALTERARAGVQVNLVLDALGSFATWHGYFDGLRRAGGRIFFYHPIRWHTLPRINNRTHRELIIVDGQVAFLGGAGFADHWLLPHGRKKSRGRWRDTMFRVEGEAVLDLQSTFAENLLETAGEMLYDVSYFPAAPAAGPTVAMVVRGTPSAGRSSRNHMLFQALIAAAQKSIQITSPYFLPDRSARAELRRAIRKRGVEVTIVTPGRHTDHLITRVTSRRLYGSLLRAGARIYEYQAAMIHTKMMVVDGLWSVVGSSNFDYRSFGINDEVNLATRDEGIAQRLGEDFAADLAESRLQTYRRWYRRPIFERAYEWVGALLERQQ